jgi:hypothetical protein
MNTAFQAFMTGLIDYAGLFPPAELDLDTALRNYARYRTIPDRWMLGRFIIPAGRLVELAPYREELFTAGWEATGEPFRFSVLVGGGATAEETLAELPAEVETMRAFLDLHGDTVRIEALEAKLPQELARSGEAKRTRDFLAAWPPLMANGGLSDLELFTEIAGMDVWPRCVGSSIACIEGIHRAATPSASGAAGPTPITRWGVKLRCGGVTSDAFPPPERVALVIAECNKRSVPLKCTAGLHHPVRFYAKDMGAWNHGFFNVFGAGLIAHTNGLAHKEIEECLLESKPRNFHFEGDTFAWRDEKVDAGTIARARQQFMTSFGSCSFSEPREDLRSLGLLG